MRAANSKTQKLRGERERERERGWEFRTGRGRLMREMGECE